MELFIFQIGSYVLLCLFPSCSPCLKSFRFYWEQLPSPFSAPHQGKIGLLGFKDREFSGAEGEPHCKGCGWVEGLFGAELDRGTVCSPQIPVSLFLSGAFQWHPDEFPVSSFRSHLKVSKWIKTRWESSSCEDYESPPTKDTHRSPCYPQIPSSIVI